METIEKRAAYYANRNHPLMSSLNRAAYNAYIAGAQSEHKELTRWRDPKKELPELLTPVLGKQSDEEKTYYKVVYLREYDDDDGCYWTDGGCRSLYIDGWRPIHENE